MGSRNYTVLSATETSPRSRSAYRSCSSKLGARASSCPDFDQSELPKALNDCTELISRENGLEETLSAIKAALPARLRETAYAIACDLVAADGEATQEELRLLELIRHRLNLERLVAAAIERGARARFQTL